MPKAILVREIGGPEALEWCDWPVSSPGEGQIAVRQTAIGLNFIDTYQRSGLYPLPTPFVAGNEGAGVVTEVGPGVKDIAVGDRVAYQGQVGAYAEQRLLAADRVVRIPDNVDDRTAAAVMLKGLTAY